MTRVVFMGTPEFAVPSLEALLREDYDIAGVLTQPDRPAGRGQRLEESPVKRTAIASGLAVLQPRTLADPQAQASLAALAADVIVVAAYGLILPRAVLELPHFGCVNVHGSLLPRHRGAAPIAAALLAGDREAGISIMLMDAGVDTGPILEMAALTVAPGDTTGSLTARLAALGAGLLARTLPRWVRGEIAAQPQPAQGATFAPRIEKEAGAINWTEPAEMIARKVRAYQPWPSAYTTWQGRRLKLLRTRVESKEAAAGEGGSGDEPVEPGRVIAGARHAAGVVCGQGVLWLEEVQIEGRRATPIAAFMQGARGFVGSRLPS